MHTMKFVICFLLAGVLTTSASISQTINKLTSKEKKNGWVLLFDGKSSKGWTTISGKSIPKGWEVKNGLLTAIKGGKGGDIITDGEFTDFDLSIDYNIEPECNSGVKYFFTKYENGGNLGMEYQILDDKLAEDNNKDNHLTGSFYDVLPPLKSKKRVKDPGQWNTMRIVVKGNNVEHWLNDVKILEYERGSKIYTDAVARSKFDKTSPTFGMVEKGHILLQEHGGVVSFKNIKIKTL